MAKEIREFENFTWIHPSLTTEEQAVDNFLESLHGKAPAG